MAKCPNCGKNIGCSCKLRTTKDGKKGCTTCINSLKNKKQKTIPIMSKSPTINNVIASRKV